MGQIFAPRLFGQFGFFNNGQSPIFGVQQNFFFFGLGLIDELLGPHFRRRHGLGRHQFADVVANQKTRRQRAGEFEQKYKCLRHTYLFESNHLKLEVGTDKNAQDNKITRLSPAAYLT